MNDTSHMQMYSNKVKLGRKTLENLVFKKKRTSNFSPKTAVHHATVEQPESSSMSRFAQFAGEIQQDEHTRNITTGQSVEQKDSTISASRNDPIAREN